MEKTAPPGRKDHQLTLPAGMAVNDSVVIWRMWIRPSATPAGVVTTGAVPRWGILRRPAARDAGAGAAPDVQSRRPAA